ncbi:hypothetical protein CCAL9344_07675 [Campylobacter sp. RM9344]|uniref:Uncharacterized protein n=1 Tax=Campylobacter californiensis TaxID=1032243 RepID=A0AAW3ZXL8_9BACT|nr:MULTISPECIES: hypothetical protein [unclassified Campylobacter]MBE2985307.1 hypothetical protein [Campylobacter sp. RM6883]MBE2987145.1 hypothetical protein [Campylobacter sp. RM12919]MBE2988823.1 hypothetical protein [Campylobacter sp. RM12920]MBE2995948.1 hypothetical protein [Campylobacter sp. RM6913]MBE3030061.1 hypothetical protein [Campylobacter sp. RM9344]
MISKIGKIQKIANAQNVAPIALNTSLPISLKVSEKIGFNRYILKFANRNLNTKSAKQLDIGANYWAEIESNNENILIKNMFKKPEILNFGILPQGLNLIERVIKENDLAWFYEHICDSLMNAKDKESFKIYTDMFLALQEKIVHIPFLYNEIYGIFQFKKGQKESAFYLAFSNFAPILFRLDEKGIVSISTPFKKVANLLNYEFSCKIETCQISPLWDKSGKIIDIKG